MTIEYCTCNSPKFQNVTNPFVRLFELLPQFHQGKLPNGDYGYLTDTDTLQLLNQLAENTVDEIHTSLPTLGALVAAAAGNVDTGLALDEVETIGWLIRLLGNLLIACNNIKENSGFELIKRGAAL